MTDLEMGAGHTLGKLVEEWHHHLKNKLNVCSLHGQEHGIL